MVKFPDLRENGYDEEKVCEINNITDGVSIFPARTIIALA
jgi:hypothetical protein